MRAIGFSLLVLLSLSCLFSFSAAQCSFNGLDVSSLSGRTLSGVFNGYPYLVNPCSSVSGVPGITCTAQACQGNIVLSKYSTSASANITWVAADNGLVQLSQNGDLCSGGDGPRENTIRLVCNAAATTAYLSDVEELSTCHYYMIIQTSLVCTPPAALKSVGSTYVSDLCGGGAYPLSELLPNDISFSPDGNQTQVYINPCFTVQSTNCANAPNPTSVCQAYYPLSSSSTNVFQIGVYDPSRTAVQYTLLSNGLVQSAQHNNSGRHQQNALPSPCADRSSLVPVPIPPCALCLLCTGTTRMVHTYVEYSFIQPSKNESLGSRAVYSLLTSCQCLSVCSLVERLSPRDEHFLHLRCW